MEKYERRATQAEIASLGRRPNYLTSIGRKDNQDEVEYTQASMKLFDSEIKAHPGYRIRMSIINGVSHFYGYKQSLADMTARRRISRSLSHVRNGLEEGVSRKNLSQRIDQILRRLSED